MLSVLCVVSWGVRIQIKIAQIKMSNLGKIVIDTWLIEAHEAVKLVEEVETRVNSKNIIVQQDHLRLSVGDDIARSKLLEAGIKLDRLESLLHNPPAKPILYVLILVYFYGYLILLVYVLAGMCVLMGILC